MAQRLDSRVAAVAAASLRPKIETIAGVMISVTRMTTSTALIVSESNRPSRAPTSVVARVAAACDPDRSDITPISGQLNRAR